MGGFTPRDPNTDGFDPIRDIARGNCYCGKWLVIPKTFTREKPLECHGPCGKEGTCDRNWFWEDDKLLTDWRQKKIERPSFDQLYMEFAHSLSRRSTCERTQVGAVVVSTDYQRVLSVGYNGGAKGVFNECLSLEPGKCGHLHAEVNALLKMDYNDPCKKVMFVTYNPCFNCAVAIINAKIDEVVYDKDYRQQDGLELLMKANVAVRKIQVKEDGEV